MNLGRLDRAAGVRGRVVEERDDVRTAGMGLVGRDEALEKLDFVEGSAWIKLYRFAS
jgi:hypothetical protein